MLDKSSCCLAVYVLELGIDSVPTLHLATRRRGGHVAWRRRSGERAQLQRGDARASAKADLAAPHPTVVRGWGWPPSHRDGTRPHLADEGREEGKGGWRWRSSSGGTGRRDSAREGGWGLRQMEMETEKGAGRDEEEGRGGGDARAAEGDGGGPRRSNEERRGAGRDP